MKFNKLTVNNIERSKAEISAGLGPASEVQFLTLNARASTSLKIRWNQPESDGGSSILSFDLLITLHGIPGAIEETNVSKTTEEYTFKGLSPSTPYDIFIWPVTAYGRGSVSSLLDEETTA